MLKNKRIGILGAGSMAEAFIRGLVAAGTVAGSQITVTNRSGGARLQGLADRYGVRTTTDKLAAIAGADIIALSCKPKDLAALLAEVGAAIAPGQIVLSFCAGIPTRAMTGVLQHGVQVVRTMPNTSCVVQESATAYCLAEGTLAATAEVVEALLSALGKVVRVEERHLDAVTGLSGSGPAYVYLMVEAMVEAGMGVGLEREIAYQLAVQTVLGAARMLAETGEQPDVLRQKVTSPGGTTMAGLQVLAEAGFTDAMVRAVARATARSREMGALLAAPALR